MIPFDDRGFTLGDGLFETILADHGRLDLWDEHVARLGHGCDSLRLPRPDEADLRRAALAALSREGLDQARAAVRVSWTAGGGGRGLDRPANPSPRLAVQAAPAPLPSSAVRLVTAAIRRNDQSPASRLKTLSYLDQVLARREATDAGADEALMLNTRGLIACASAANIFWIADGVLHTPALDCGVLDGVMRAQVIARAPMTVLEVRAPREALAGAEAIFLSSSLIGLRPVSALDGQPVGGDALVRAIRDAVF